MAKVKLAGKPMTATPVECLPNGDWIMRSNEKHARVEPGHRFRVKQSEIIEMAAAEMPPAKTEDEMSKLAALAAMLAETNKTIEDGADQHMARIQAAKDKAKNGMAKIDSVVTNLENGVADVEKVANQLSNFGPPLDK